MPRVGIGPDNTWTNNHTPVFGSTGIAASFSPVVAYEVAVTGDGAAELQYFAFVGGGSGACDMDLTRPCYESLSWDWHFMVYNSAPANLASVQIPDIDVIVPVSRMTVTDDFGSFVVGFVFPSQKVEFDLSGLGIDLLGPTATLVVYAAQPEPTEVWGVLGTSEALSNDRSFSSGTPGGFSISPRGVDYY